MKFYTQKTFKDMNATEQTYLDMDARNEAERIFNRYLRTKGPEFLLALAVRLGDLAKKELAKSNPTPANDVGGDDDLFE